MPVGRPFDAMTPDVQAHVIAFLRDNRDMDAEAATAWLRTLDYPQMGHFRKEIVKVRHAADDRGEYDPACGW